MKITTKWGNILVIAWSLLLTVIQLDVMLSLTQLTVIQTDVILPLTHLTVRLTLTPNSYSDWRDITSHSPNIHTNTHPTVIQTDVMLSHTHSPNIQTNTHPTVIQTDVMLSLTQLTFRLTLTQQSFRLTLPLTQLKFRLTLTQQSFRLTWCYHSLS